MKKTAEERQLGLDPELYTKKQWNPADYFGWSKASNVIPKFTVSPEQTNLEKIRDQYVDKDQEIEGIEIPKLSDSELIQVQQQDWFSKPKNLWIMKKLGLKTNNGIPILDENDENLMNKATNNELPAMSERAKLLKNLFEGE